MFHYYGYFQHELSSSEPRYTCSISSDSYTPRATFQVFDEFTWFVCFLKHVKMLFYSRLNDLCLSLSGFGEV